jgi:hypothetical protein
MSRLLSSDVLALPFAAARASQAPVAPRSMHLATNFPLVMRPIAVKHTSPSPVIPSSTRKRIKLGSGSFHCRKMGQERARRGGCRCPCRHFPRPRELSAVAQRLGAQVSDIHLGRDASETTVKRLALDRYRVVYFATHGLVAGDVIRRGSPVRSDGNALIMSWCSASGTFAICWDRTNGTTMMLAHTYR